MGYALSLVLIAAGAILTWAVDVTVNGLDLAVAGVILMVIGIVGLVLNLAFWSDFNFRRDRDYIDKQ